MIKDIIYYKKYRKILRSVYDDKSLRFIQALNASFGVEFKRDKEDRLYTVINPYIQKMSEGDDGNNIIYDGNNKPMVEKWVMDNFVLIDNIIHANELFDLVSVDIQKIDDDLNYLLIIQNALYNDYKKALKKLRWICGGCCVAILVLCMIFL